MVNEVLGLTSFASLFASEVELTLLDISGDVFFGDADGSHSSDLHSHVASDLSVGSFVEGYDRSEHVPWVDVRGRESTLDELVYTELHLFTRDTAALGDVVLYATAVSHRSSEDFFLRSTLLSLSYFEDRGDELDEVFVLSDEVRFALDAYHDSIVAFVSSEDAAFFGFVVATLSSDSLATLTDEFDSLFEVASSFFDSLLNIGETSTGEGAELLDVFQQFTHDGILY